MKTREAPQVPRPTFLGGSKGLWIGGKWLPAASGEEFDTYNPADGTVIARLARGSDVDVDRAVTAARVAFEGEWTVAHVPGRGALGVRCDVNGEISELAIEVPRATVDRLVVVLIHVDDGHALHVRNLRLHRTRGSLR